MNLTTNGSSYTLAATDHFYVRLLSVSVCLSPSHIICWHSFLFSTSFLNVITTPLDPHSTSAQKEMLCLTEKETQMCLWEEAGIGKKLVSAMICKRLWREKSLNNKISRQSRGEKTMEIKALLVWRWHFRLVFWEFLWRSWHFFYSCRLALPFLIKETRLINETYNGTGDSNGTIQTIMQKIMMIIK